MLVLINMVFSGAKDSVCNKKTHGFHLFVKTSRIFPDFVIAPPKILFRIVLLLACASSWASF